MRQWAVIFLNCLLRGFSLRAEVLVKFWPIPLRDKLAVSVWTVVYCVCRKIGRVSSFYFGIWHSRGEIMAILWPKNTNHQVFQFYCSKAYNNNALEFQWNYVIWNSTPHFIYSCKKTAFEITWGIIAEQVVPIPYPLLL